MAKDNRSGGALRDWASASYNAETGKPCSAFTDKTSIEGMKVAGNSQIAAARSGGSGHGNVGVSAMSKSGSADMGRRKYGAST